MKTSSAGRGRNCLGTNSVSPKYVMSLLVWDHNMEADYYSLLNSFFAHPAEWYSSGDLSLVDSADPDTMHNWKEMYQRPAVDGRCGNPP